MARNLIVFSDGTGNSGGKTRGTNVWRLYNLVDIHSTYPEQRTFYEDGVGTEEFKLLRTLGGAFGWGLSRNLRRLYTFLVKNYDAYQPEDNRIYLFGFSRGAFTVRALAGMLAKCGLWDRDEYFRCSAPQRVVNRILWAYREARTATGEGTTRLARLRNDGFTLHQVRIKFIGVWDTVDAVGVPMDELRVVLDRLLLWLPVQAWRVRLYGFHDRKLSDIVEHARQALAIDDERRTFHPNVWEPRDGVIEQVWFAGAHSNVGGSYPKDGMAGVTLDWMMGELERALPQDERLRWVPQAREEVMRRANAYDYHYDPRSGPGAYYRYSPRRLVWFYTGEDDFYQRLARRLAGRRPDYPQQEFPVKIHISVWRRVVRASQEYAPRFIPAGAVWVGSWHSKAYAADDLTCLPALPEATNECIKKLVLARQVAYLVLSFASLVGLGLGFLATPEHGRTVPLADYLLPRMAHKLSQNAATYPELAMPIVLTAALGGITSLLLGKRIATLAFCAWQQVIGDFRARCPETFRRSLQRPE